MLLACIGCFIAGAVMGVFLLAILMAGNSDRYREEVE